MHPKVRSIFVYPSLEDEDIPSSYTFEVDQTPSSKICGIQAQPFKPQKIKDDLIPFVLPPISSKFQERYKPLKLHFVLHDYPPEYYKYLPMFNGELEKITAEKHVEAFEHFVDLFEIDYDDLCLRIFAKSLQGDVKQWFRHLQSESIDSWTELR